MNPKIVQLVKGIDIGGENGGAEYFGIRLSQELAKKGFDVTLCSIYRYDTEIERHWHKVLINHQVRVVFIKGSGKIKWIEAFKKFNDYVTSLKSVIVHSHNHIGTMFTVFVKLFSHKLRLLRTVHTPLEFGSGLRGSLSRLLLVNTIYPLFMQHEVGVSQEIVNNLNRRLLTKLLKRKARIIHNSVPELPNSKENEIVLSKFFSSLDKVSWFISSIGLFTPNKRFDLLIRSLPIILDRIPNAQVILAGNGVENDSIKKLAKDLGVEDRIWFIGSQVAVFDLLRRSDLFVLPSMVEGFSTVIMEAMLSEVPVVAADIPGNRELIQDGYNGILFQAGDEKSLAEAIILVHDNPVLSLQFVQRSKDFIKRFNMSDVVDQYIELFAQV